MTVKLLKADKNAFKAAANAAKIGCTVSRLVNTKITMDAKMESAENFSEAAREPDLIPLRRVVTPGSRREKFEPHVANNSTH